PLREKWRRLRLVAMFQYASPGAPVLQYGTESGMWGAAEPDNEKPMLWKDLAFEPEATHPLDHARKAEAVRFDDALLKFFQGLGELSGIVHATGDQRSGARTPLSTVLKEPLQPSVAGAAHRQARAVREDRD